jgi:hypothetical protein
LGITVEPTLAPNGDILRAFGMLIEQRGRDYPVVVLVDSDSTLSDLQSLFFGFRGLAAPPLQGKPRACWRMRLQMRDRLGFQGEWVPHECEQIKNDSYQVQGPESKIH